MPIPHTYSSRWEDGLTVSDWKPEGDPKLIDSTFVQYLRHSHSHEGAYQVTMDGAELVVLPDPDIGTRKRAGLIASGIAHGNDTMNYLIGYLVIAGLTNLTLNGAPLIDDSTRAGHWRLDLADTGEVRATWIGGSR